MVRPPAVAGTFYPADPGELRATVDGLLARAPAGPVPKALIVPHAGYVYSGAVAAAGFARVAGRPFARVVLLGPSHFAPLRGLALPQADRFSTPLGEVEVEFPDLPHVVQSDAPHAREHSLEVELPFLIAALGAFRLVPLAVGGADPETVAEVIERAWGGAETLIVVSSDLSHYLDYRSARARDESTARSIESLRLVDPDDACGAAPVNGLLTAARRRGLRVERIDLRNSGDTAGDKARVVGYGAFAFLEAA